MTATAQRFYDTSGAFVREDTSRAPGHDLRDRRRPQPLAPARRDALRVLRRQQERRGRTLAEGRLLPGRLGARSDAHGPEQQRLQPVGDRPLPVLREEQTRRRRPGDDGDLSRAGATSTGPSVAFQWVDVSDVKPGTYWLAASSDPNNAVIESNEANNGVAFAAAPSVDPGLRRAAGERVERRRRSDAEQFDARRPGVRRRPGPGSSRSSALLHTERSTRRSASRSTGRRSRTQPSASFSGSDSFTYDAIDANSEFPRTPARAARSR